MSDATALRERASRCRAMAKEYHPSVGRPLWEKALELDREAAPDLMAYASLAKGFKSGGFNARFVANLPNLGLAPFAPGIAVSYEMGLRSEWLGRRVRLNATLFHTDYDDIQLRRQTVFAAVTTTLIENAAKARIRGTELELVAAPLEGLTLTAAYGHLDAKYLDVGRVPGITLASRFQRTPKHSFSSSVDYRVPLVTGTLELHADYSYRSKEQFQITASRFDQEGYALVGARAAFRSRGDSWSVAIFATNLTDKRYRTAGRGTHIKQTGLAHSSIGLPRQLGLQIRRQF